MHKRLFLVFLCIFFIAHTVSAVDLDQVYIEIDRNGDATITVSYQSNPLEYAGVKIAAVSPGQYLDTKLSAAFKRSTRVECTQPGAFGLKIQKFATVNGDTYRTPEISLQQSNSQTTLSSIISINPRTDVVIVFPDGYYQEKKDTEVIPAVDHTITKNTVQATVSPRTECRKKENLPLAGIIPDEAEPIAAVATGVVVTGVALGTTTMGSSIASFFDKLSTLVKKLIGQKALKKVSDTLELKNKTETVSQPAWIFGFTKSEILVLVAGILILTFAFLIAKRVPWDPVMILIFFVMAGVALVIHEITHALFSRKYKSPSEFKFWGLGSLFLFVGGWLFGTVFSQPYLTVAGSTPNTLDLQNRAIVKVSGPIISLLIAILCFYMIPFAGGLLATTLTVGFSINLMVCVYSLIPVSPLDGKDVYAWNRLAWGILFVPLLILYLIVNM